MTKIAAIFDLDETILDRSSGRLFVRYLRKTSQTRRYFRRRDLALAAMQMLGWRLGVSHASPAMQRTARIAAGIDLDEFWSLIHHWFDEMVVHAIRAKAAEAVDCHRSLGHIPIICSAASQFSVLPVAEYLGIEHTIFTEWAATDGRLTGELRLPIAYGVGKLIWTRKWAADHDIDLSQSTFYTDHHSDIPLLEAVGSPVAVNPSRKLARIAQARGWRMVDWGPDSPLET